MPFTQHYCLVPMRRLFSKGEAMDASCLSGARSRDSGGTEWVVTAMKRLDEGKPEEDKTPSREAVSASASSSDPTGIQPSDETNTLAEMLPLVYEELRQLAGGYMRHERPEHTLQRTALIHEAYLRLSAQNVVWENRAQLLGIFARLMRQTLINHAVARTRRKRGGSNPTDLILEFYEQSQIDVAAVDEALKELETLDPRQAQIVELRFFAGLTIEEIAAALHISPTTVKREWNVAKLWLRQNLVAPG